VKRQYSSQEHEEHCLKPKNKYSHEATTAKPKKWAFFCLLSMFFLSQQITISYTNTFEYKKLTKKTLKYQNQA